MKMMFLLVCIFSLVTSENTILTSRLKHHQTTAVKVDLDSEVSLDSNRKKRSLGDHNVYTNANIKIIKTILLDDAHTTAYVEWGGTDKESDTILVLTRDSRNPPTESSLYISTNYGNDFVTEKIYVNNKPLCGSYIYQSPTNHRKFMINDVKNKAVVVSKDEGKTWKVHSTPFYPYYIVHHPTVDGLTLAYDQKNRKLYYSRDFGESYVAILSDSAVVDYYWSNSQYDTNSNTIYVSVKQDDLLTVMYSMDFFQSNKNVIDKDVKEFLMVDDFYFTIKKSTHKNHGSKDMDLFISYDRGTLIKAQFPPELSNQPTQEFFVADAGLGQVFVAVSHKDNSTNLYVSEHKGENMELSLPRVLYTNQASFERIDWLVGEEPFTDFQAIEGLPGVFIASQIDAGEVGHRRIHTVMTYNKGATWQSVQPPEYDIDGNPLQCHLPDCSLQISLRFGTKFPNAKHTPLLTKANAPGLIMASGNLGQSHTIRNSLFMSNDGGVKWFPVLRGDYNYQFADHGGIIVATSQYPTTEIQYSHNEGLTWHNYTVSDKDIMIYGLITEPGELTTVFNLYATNTKKMEWIILTLDFKDFLGPKCTKNDFLQWSIRDELKNSACVLGLNTIYERKSRHSHCYIGSDYRRTISNESCPCQASDFECDFLYSRNSANDPCLIVNGVDESWFIPSSCSPGNSYNKSMGYIKIEGDACKGGEEKLFSTKLVKCPDNGIKNLSITAFPSNAIKLGDTVTLRAVSEAYESDIFFLWDINGNLTSGSGSDFEQITRTFDRTGSYLISLTASNGAGSTVALTKVTVDVEVKGLSIKVSPADPVLEEPLVLIVTKDNSVDPNLDIALLNYRWYTNGSSNPAEDTYLPLLLYSFKTPGLKTIFVTVSNSISSLNVSTTFVVTDILVSQISGIPVDSQSVQLAWNPPTQRANLVSAYTLKYRSATDYWKKISLSVNETYYLVTGLSPDQEYTFIIITSSMSGATSRESASTTVKTLPKNVKQAPTKVKVTPAGNKATVTWTAAKSPQSYTVDYWMSDRVNTPKSHTVTATSIKLTDLTKGAAYSIRVAAVYPENVMSYSDVVHVQIEGYTPDLITDIEGYSQSPSSLVLRWEPPKAPVDSYNVYNGSTSTLLKKVVGTTVKFVNLLPYHEYRFYISSVVGKNEGEKSKIYPVRTLAGVPGPPTKATCYMNNAGGAVIQWHQPDHPNGVITGYSILPKFGDAAKQELSGNQTSYTYTGLRKYEVYDFAIIAKGDYEESLPTFVQCQMTTGVPGPVDRIYVKNIGITTVELLWKPPRVAATALTYDVKYAATSGSANSKVQTTSHIYMTLEGLAASTEYNITITARNSQGSGPESVGVIANTLTPPIGSIEYEVRFKSVEFKDKITDTDEFSKQLITEVSQYANVPQHRIIGVGIAPHDPQTMEVTFWITPRDTSNPDSLSAESIVTSIDKHVAQGDFTVGDLKAINGRIEKQAVSGHGHHDAAEIVIPCIGGVIIVVLVAGLLYYRNRYHQIKRRYRITSHFSAVSGQSNDTNMIECAEEPEGISSQDLQSGALSINQEASPPTQPSKVRHFFKRFNYQPVDQDDPDELLDDDEEHLLPL